MAGGARLLGDSRGPRAPAAASLALVHPRVSAGLRRHSRAFHLALALTLAGCAFGGLAIRIDPEAKNVLMPFEGLQKSPAERVAQERRTQGKQLTGVKGTFSADLMTHNTQVALTT